MGEIKPSINAFFALSDANGGASSRHKADVAQGALTQLFSSDAKSVTRRADPRYQMTERERAEAMLPCFTPHSVVATQRGAVCVSDIVPGDFVLTRDNGYQEVLWVGGKTYASYELAEYLQPIMIKAGALGDGIPAKDMVVSPRHRFLVSDKAVSALTGANESFVAAKFLVRNEGVGVVTPQRVRYVQIMCQHHEVLMVDGVWTESFQPSSAALEGLCEAERMRLLAVCPDLKTPDVHCNITPARRSLRKADISKLKG